MLQNRRTLDNDSQPKLIFHAPLTNDYFDVINGLQGIPSGNISISSNGAIFTQGFIRYVNIPLNVADLNQPYTITYTIRNTTVSASYHQIGCEFGTHLTSQMIAFYTPRNGNTNVFTNVISIWGPGDAGSFQTYQIIPGFNYSVFRNEKITWNGLNNGGVFNWYIDDILIGTATRTSNFPTLVNALNIGGGSQSADNLRGVIRDVKLYDMVI
jgi:hypothetical protein